MNEMSLEAYEKIKSTLGEKQMIVYMAIDRYPKCSNEELRMILGWEINCITGRVKELRDLKLVCLAGKKFNERTQMNVNAWRVTTDEERKDNQYSFDLVA